MGLHCGAVDNVPDISDMLRSHRIRYLAIHCKIVDSHSIQIHRSNAVIIGRITAGLAAEDMFLLVTVGLFRVTANRTGLTYITRVHVDYGTLVECSLVLQFLLKVVKRPGHGNVAVFTADLLR